ncbi:MAG: PH domain-containing protein, partial [Pseudomonadota bacterium]
MSEYDHEPVRGLPGKLPEGEHIIWQGAPDWKRLALSALHIRLAALYFAAMGALSLLRGDMGTAAVIAISGAAVIGFFALFAWAVGRTTLYTLTNRRVVLRIGVAL